MRIDGDGINSELSNIGEFSEISAFSSPALMIGMQRWETTFPKCDFI